MLKKIITGLAAFRSLDLAAPAVFVGRSRTCDSMTAFAYRMGAGFPGTPNRSHPMSIEPTQMDPDNPVAGFGLACVISAANPNMVRQMAPGDNGLTKIYGITVRPYPVQQTTGGMNSGFGVGAPALDQPLDVLTSGYIMVPVFGAATKGAPVYVRVAASIDGRPQGGFEVDADGADNILLANTIGNIEFNGPADANGYGEVRFRI